MSALGGVVLGLALAPFFFTAAVGAWVWTTNRWYTLSARLGGMVCRVAGHRPQTKHPIPFIFLSRGGTECGRCRKVLSLD